MNKRLLLSLFVAVGCVAWVVHWQAERERAGEFDVARPLLEDVRFKRVVSMRISNLARGADIELKQDATGKWFMVDPVAYRADDGVMELMRQIVEGNLALKPADPMADHARVGLDPPQAEWVLTEVVDGEERTHRMLIGDPDPTGNRVYVLQEGELVLTSRNLANTLDRDFPEFRSRRISMLNSAHVTEVQRTGRVQHESGDEAYDLELGAWREGASWRSLRPFEAALDPLDVSLVVVGAGRLSFEQYIEEPEPDLGVYGLAEPEVRVELKTTSGASEVLFLGRPQVGGLWFCRREGTPDVYRVASRDAVLLTYPVEAMLDRRLVRVDPKEVLAVRLERPDGSLRLAREGAGWSVAEGDDMSVPAEAFVVRDLLAWIGEAELLPFEGASPQMTLSGGGRRLVLEVEGGELGGEIGDAAPAEEGDAVWYRRFGDEVVGRLDAEVLEWLERPVDTWWSLSLLELDELQVVELVLSRGEEELRYARGKRGRWRDERGREVTELLPWLDPLLFLRATERVGLNGAKELETVVGVRFVLSSGESRAFVVGAGPQGRSECEIGPVRAVLLRRDLHAGLLALFP